jgi:hypothetical protein
VAAAGLLLTAGPAVAGNFTYIAKGTQCIPSGSAEAPLVQARTSFLMFGDQTGLGFYAYILQARLVPPGAGLNFVRPWQQVKVPAPLTGASSRRLTVTTSRHDGLKDWKLQVKLVWDRPGPVNYTRTLNIPFQECAPAPDGQGPLPTPVQPLPGGST